MQPWETKLSLDSVFVGRVIKTRNLSSQITFESPYSNYTSAYTIVIGMLIKLKQDYNKL